MNIIFVSLIILSVLIALIVKEKHERQVQAEKSTKEMADLLNLAFITRDSMRLSIVEFSDNK